MANTMTEVMPKLLAQGLLALRQQAIMPRLVNRAYETQAADRGSTINVPIPSAIAAQAVSPAATPPSTADIIPTSVAIQLTEWWEAPFYLTDKDLLEIMDGVIPMQASEAIKSLANKIDQTILGKYVGVYGWAGTAGTTPFGTDLSEYTEARTVLNRQLAPINDRRVVLNPDAEGNALLLRAFQDASFGGGTGVILEGQIGRKVGAEWWMDQNMPSHTTGAATAGTIALDDTVARAVGTTTLHMDGFSVKPSVGDVFTIAGDTQTYVVTASTTLAGTDSDVSFQPGLMVAIPAVDGNEVVTFKASHAVNLAFHRDAFAFASRPLLDTNFPDMQVAMQSAVDPLSGVTLRLEITREHKRWRWSFDTLFGAALVRAQLAARIAG